MITAPFAFKTRREAEALGMADLPLLVLPHPLASLPAKEVRDLAEEAIAETQYALTASSENVAQRYRGRVSAADLEPAREELDEKHT